MSGTLTTNIKPHSLVLPDSVWTEPAVQAVDPDAVRFWLTILPYADPIGVIPLSVPWLRTVPLRVNPRTDDWVYEQVGLLDNMAAEAPHGRLVYAFAWPGPIGYCLVSRFWDRFSAGVGWRDRSFRWGPETREEIPSLPQEFALERINVAEDRWHRRCEYDQIINLYHEVLCPPWPRIVDRTSKVLRAGIRATWVEHRERAWWRAYFEASRRLERARDLRWLVKPESPAKVMAQDENEAEGPPPTEEEVVEDDA